MNNFEWNSSLFFQLQNSSDSNFQADQQKKIYKKLLLDTNVISFRVFKSQ